MWDPVVERFADVFGVTLGSIPTDDSSFLRSRNRLRVAVRRDNEVLAPCDACYVACTLKNPFWTVRKCAGRQAA